jgi:arginyl-tRNA synthetase
MAEARADTAKLQAGDPDTTRVWQRLRDISLTAQRQDIDLLNAHFDLFLGESDVQLLIPPMIADMQARGVAVESDGALIVEVADPSDAKPMPPLLLAKSDGAALYATTDLATIVARKRDPNPDRILYVVDSGHRRTRAHVSSWKPIFVELKSRRGVASKTQKQICTELLPAGAEWWLTQSAARR